ncbi:MAG: DUF814 domain-containing protein [Gemmatimonadetes bacterium]|nr:DUF814 domain-containing protein [Gemmatimonadota bacterium]
MHARLLQDVLPEIRDLVGLRVTRADVVGKFGVLIHFSGSRKLLWLSGHPELSRIGLVAAAPEIGPPRAAADSLSEPLLHATLLAVEQEPGGRVARLRFEREEDAPRHRNPVIVAELIPRFANVILVGDGDRILWARREFRGAERPRQIAAGERYVEPSGGPGGDGDPPFPWPPEGSANDAVDAWYRPQEEAEFSGHLLAEFRRTLVKRRKRAAKALVQIERRLEEAGREAEIRHDAEVLAAHLGDVKKGMESVTLPDFDGTATVEIKLDPKLDPRGNLEALFKKARRLARGRDEMIAQKSIQEAELEDVDAGLEALDPEPDADTLHEWVKKLAPSLLKSAPGKKKTSAKPETQRIAGLPEGFNPRYYLLPGGWEVLVGRNAKQNDELTHRHARQRDLWFHARGSQGSHTVLRVASGKGEPSRDTIEAAAAIAAFHSKARNSNLVPVAYTEKRYVRKPRKAPVGTALMMREKVIMVEPRLPENATA